MPPPLTVATSLLPSAEQATALQGAVGEPFTVQAAPPLVEMRSGPAVPDALAPAAAAKVMPSAEEATNARPRPNRGVPPQVSPELVEVKTAKPPPWPGG